VSNNLSIWKHLTNHPKRAEKKQNCQATLTWIPKHGWALEKAQLPLKNGKCLVSIFQISGVDFHPKFESEENPIEMMREIEMKCFLNY